jgi:hypothetical protein
VMAGALKVLVKREKEKKMDDYNYFECESL